MSYLDLLVCERDILLFQMPCLGGEFEDPVITLSGPSTRKNTTVFLCSVALPPWKVRKTGS